MFWDLTYFFALYVIFQIWNINLNSEVQPLQASSAEQMHPGIRSVAPPPPPPPATPPAPHSPGPDLMAGPHTSQSWGTVFATHGLEPFPDAPVLLRPQVWTCSVFATILFSMPYVFMTSALAHELFSPVPAVSNIRTKGTCSMITCSFRSSAFCSCPFPAPSSSACPDSWVLVL